MEPFDGTVVGQSVHGENVREQEMPPPVAEDQLVAEEFAADDERTREPGPRESGEQERTAGVEQGRNSTPW